MSVEKKTCLRVLYTINASPQYILAKSHARVPVAVIPPAEDGSSQNASNSQPLYASVLLKTCLNTVRRSSPELTHDSNRDFSIYVLDPLESNSAPAPVQISNASESPSFSNNPSAEEQPRGVAVGLGLMSWALTADDSDAMTVVGTLIKQANGQEALEVIFALRETVVMKKPTWNIQPNSSQPSSSQDSTYSSTSDAMQFQGYPSFSQGSSSSYQHPKQPSASNSMQTRSSTADLTRETLASIQMRAKAKVKPPKLPKPARQSTIPVTESDKLMNADTYIGPLKKKGRPKTTGLDNKSAAPYTNAVAAGSGSGSVSSSHPKEVIVIDGSDSDGAVPTPTATIFTIPSVQDASKKKRSTQHPKTPPFTTKPLARRIPNPEPIIAPDAAPIPMQVKAEPQEEPSLLDILAYLSATSSSEPNAQNAAILAALSTIDSPNVPGKQPEDNAPNPSLVAALKQLLSVCTKPPLNSEPVNPEPVNPERPKHHCHSSSQDDDIVILDKENVNPVAHQKRLENDCQSLKLSDTTSATMSSSPANISSGQTSHQERHVQSLGPSARSNEASSSRAPLIDSVLASSSDKIVRKRTLSDFMDERENGRSKGKGKERERVEKRDGHRHAQSQHLQRVQKPPVNDSLRHYPRLLASNHPRNEPPSNNYYRLPLESMAMTSPVRPRPEFDSKPPGQENTGSESFVLQSSGFSSQLPLPSPPRRLRVSASSPVRGPQNESRRKYVVPEWARTSTSTQPRLSEEAQRALDEAEERKRQERSAARKRLPSVQAKLKSKDAAASSKTNSNTCDPQLKPLAPPPPLKPDASRGPITANSDRPMVAVANITFPFITSTRSSSPPPQPNVTPKTPKTPSRERHHARPTSGAENNSLFTPVMGSGSFSLFGSAHSYSHRTPLPSSVLTSPLGNRKKAKLTPTRSNFTGKAFSIPAAWASSSSAPTSDSKNMEEETNRDSLDQELEDALDDLEPPSSSLPIASSDIDVDESHAQTSGDADLDIGDDESESLPIKQHWAGLPPSSPPAPSSPMLLPESSDNDIQTDDEMDDLPIATSDSETDTEMTDTTSPNAQSPAYLNDNSAPGNCDFSALFTSEEFSAESEHPTSSDLFDQFTNLNDHSDIFPGIGEINMDPEMEALFQNGLDNIDFTEFWETFKPLVNDSTQASQELSDQCGGEYFEPGQENSLLSLGEVDHAKLADDMQSLLSGCLM